MNADRNRRDPHPGMYFFHTSGKYTKNSYNLAMRLLVVDDSPITRAMLCEMASGEGHEIAGEAETVSDAVQGFKDQKPDLVLMDLSLMDGDGLSAIKMIRELDKTAKILVISGNSQKKIFEQATDAGAIGFLVKPVDYHEFKAILQRISAE